MSLRHPVVCIVGPTASGKTDVAQAVALRIGASVVSADSMQIYRGMDIGTGKIAAADRRVEHFGLDICEPGQPYSAALFQDYARSCFASLDAEGNRSVLAGGTGLYVRAAIDDYRFPRGEQVENPVRSHYAQVLEEQGAQALWRILEARDPESAALIHPNNTRRVIRAFEMMELEGTTYARQHEGFSHMAQFVPACFFGLAVDPDVLNDRIERRVERMVSDGLVDEVVALRAAGFEDALTAREAIGYKEIVSALEGECSLEEGIEQIKTATRRYAKRQRTWWRKDSRVRWIDANDGDVERMADEILSLLDAESLQRG
ncbi:MAG: tRNA (adenosine(37)-N6)-dimethylallyltransferase MiaA [Slackia sp.]|nr:tRNA (adenosine(37)-N6)-dimethylallyltransferase MiaA [Slackia sp.]